MLDMGRNGLGNPPMSNWRITISAMLFAAALCGCAHESDTALTEWGTSCAAYGLSPKQCHAKFANYAEYMAHVDGKRAADKQRAK